MVDQAIGAALDCLLKQQPGQVAAEEVKRVVVAGAFGDPNFEAPLKDEDPAKEEYNGVYESPEPAGGGTDEAGFKVALNELGDQAAAFEDDTQEAGNPAGQAGEGP